MDAGSNGKIFDDLEWPENWIAWDEMANNTALHDTTLVHTEQSCTIRVHPGFKVTVYLQVKYLQNVAF